MEELMPILKRIADAFDEQNHQSAQWIALQTQWHDQGDPNDLRILAMYEVNAAKDQAWRDMLTKAFERFLEEQRDIIVAGLSKIAQQDEE